MEVELVHQVLELALPSLQLTRVVTYELLSLVASADESYAGGHAQKLFSWFIFGPDDLEDSFEGDHEAPLG